MARNSSTPLIVIIIAAVVIAFAWQAGYLEKLGLGAVYTGGQTPTVLRPSCTNISAGTVSDVFVCDADKCVVNVKYPRSVLNNVTLENYNLVNGVLTSSWSWFYPPSGICVGGAYAKTTTECVKSGSNTPMIPSGYYYPGVPTSTEQKQVFASLGCNIDNNCVISYMGGRQTGSYGDVLICYSGTMTSVVRNSCSYNIKTFKYVINKNILISDRGVNNQYAMVAETTDVRNNILLDDMTSLTDIVISNGGSVSASGASISYTKYAQCVDCAPGTGNCLVGSMSCVDTTHYQSCTDAGNNCGALGSSQQVPAGQQCVGGHLICDNQCSAEGLYVTSADGTSYQRCTRNTQTGCLYLSQTQTCPAGKKFNVNTGACDICITNQCQPEGSYTPSADGSSYQQCVVGAQGCLVYGVTQYCPAGTRFNSTTHLCSICTSSQCSALGEYVPSADGSSYQTCIQNTNGCLVLGSVYTCPAGVTFNPATHTCDICVASQCSAEGAYNVSADGTRYQRCMENPSNGCLYLGSMQVCPNGMRFNPSSQACDICISNQCAAGSYVPSGDGTSYQTCLVNTYGCLYLSEPQDCPSGTRFNENTHECDLCLAGNQCGVVGTRTKINDATYTLCEASGVCKILTTHTCLAGKVLDASFNCVRVGMCTEGAKSCTEDKTAVMKCVGGDYVQDVVCTQGTACVPETSVCATPYSLAITVSKDFAIGETITFNVQVSSPTSDYKNKLVTSSVESGGSSYGMQTKYTDTYGFATFNLPAVTTSGVYSLKAVVGGVEKTMDLRVYNKFKVEFFDAALTQYNNNPVELSVRVLDTNDAPVYNFQITPTVTVDSMPIDVEPTKEILNQNELKYIWESHMAGTMEAKFTLTKDGYQPSIATRAINLYASGIKMTFDAVGKKSDTLVEFSTPGSKDVTVVVKDIATSQLVDADSVTMDLAGTTIDAVKTATGTYTFNYAFTQSFYDALIKVKKGESAISKRVTVNVFGGEGVSSSSSSGGSTSSSSSSGGTGSSSSGGGGTTQSPGKGFNWALYALIGAVVVIGGVIFFSGRKR